MTANAQAILLLTAPLIAGREDRSPGLLSLSEYNRLTRVLREKQKQPADLIGSEAQEVIGLCTAIFDRARLEDLLGRGFLLSQAVDRWNARGIWVVSRADDTYPRRLKTRLRGDAPPVLYGCGDAALLETGGLAVVGSRHVDEELVSYTENVGRLAADAHRTVISGGAKGIDRAAMHGALQAGGTATGVMADSLERAALARDNREPLIDQRLVFVSPYDPAAGFNVGHAMQRNKIIYALADAAFVVTSDFEKGGTWAGAIEQLERLHFVPVFVRDGVNAGKGNSALLQRGARPWPDLHHGGELSEALSAAAASMAAEPKQDTLSFVVREEPPAGVTGKDAAAAGLPASAAEIAPPSAEQLLKTVRDILIRELAEARNESEVAKLLVVSKPQAKGWLEQLVAEGVLEKLSKPARYRTAKSLDRLL
jgi:predicted Rossmann fold nucleotide-binding protein DprA/Smf involved in DNA uptake